MTTGTQELAILKGASFTARLEEVCRDPLRVQPLPGLKYRRILIPGVIGGEVQFALLGFIAQALRMRGADVTALMCDKLLPACTLRKIDHHESACTRWCHKNAVPFARAMGLPHRWYSEFITPDEVVECDRAAREVAPPELLTVAWKGIDLGRHIGLSIDSFFKVGRFDPDNPEMLASAYDFLRAGMYLVIVADRALEQLGIDKVLMEDGQKIDWGVFRSVAARRGIPVDVAMGSTRGASMTFERDRPGEGTQHMPEWRTWRHEPLTGRQTRQLAEYFATRATVPYEGRTLCSWAIPAGAVEVRRQLGLLESPSGKVFGMFPNLSYDAGLTSTNPAFPTAAEWVVQTMRFFQDHLDPHHFLLVKVHPAELERNVLDPLMSVLSQHFDAMPANVRVIPPDSTLTAHDVIRQLDVALVYTSTVAVEAGYMGKPVVLAGGGPHTGMGVTYDAATPEQYFALLHDMCAGRMPPPIPQVLRDRYAYAVFFRSIVPINYFGERELNVVDVNLDTLADLAPGKDRSLDTICRGVLMDEPFVNPTP